MTSNYPYIGCLRPKAIADKRNKGQKILVACGCCTACTNNRLARYKRLCELEELSEYKYTYFVTLTYRDDVIPTYQLVNSNGRYKLLDLNPRSDTYNEVLDHEFSLTSREREILNSRTTLGKDKFSYLYYRDVQLFNKLLRKRIKQKYEEQVRMFAVGEYGPLSLRAHWHIIYFARKPLPAVFCNRYISKVWQYGRVDADRTKGGCISYASSYLNSAAVLPSVYKAAKISPFARHSVKLGFGYMSQQNIAALDDLLSVETARGCDFSSHYPSDGVFKPLPLDKTYKAAIYPKPFGFDALKSNKSYLQYLRAYEYYGQVYRDCDLSSVKDLTHCVFDSLYRSNIALSDYDIEFKGFIQMYDHPSPWSDDDLARAFSRLYRFFLFSKFYCARLSTDSKYLQKLFAFYDAQDYNALLTQLQLQEIFANEYELNSDSLECFYATTYSFDKLKKTMAYSAFANEQDRIHQKKITRKRFNDLAGVLNN